LEPGAHTLQAKKGDRVVTPERHAKAGETREIKLKLGAEAAPASRRSPATQTQKEPAQENPSETPAEVQVVPRASESRSSTGCSRSPRV
jgi:hypothetical protein